MYIGIFVIIYSILLYIKKYIYFCLCTFLTVPFSKKDLYYVLWLKFGVVPFDSGSTT